MKYLLKIGVEIVFSGEYKGTRMLSLLTLFNTSLFDNAVSRMI